MWSLIGDIEKPRFLLVPCAGEKLQRMVRHGIGGEVFPGGVFALRTAFRQANHHARFPRIQAMAVDEPVKFVKAALGWTRLIDMPFSNHRSAVACFLENLREGHGIIIQAPSVARRSSVAPDEAPDPGLVWVESGQQTCPRGATAAGIVGLRKANSILGEGIEIRGFDFPSVAAHIGPAEIIGEDEENVRRGWLIGCDALLAANTKSQNEAKQGVAEWHNFNWRLNSNRCQRGLVAGGQLRVLRVSGSGRRAGRR